MGFEPTTTTLATWRSTTELLPRQVTNHTKPISRRNQTCVLIDATFTQYKGVAREFKSISPRPTDRPIGRVFEKTSPLELS